MSSLYVRQLAKQWVAGLVTPFYNTANEEQNPADAVWMSLEYDAYTTIKETYCEDWTEEGTIRLVFFGTPGVGDDSLFLIAQQDANTFFNNTDSTGKLTLTILNAPVEFGGPDTPFYGVEVSIDYTYTH